MFSQANEKCSLFIMGRWEKIKTEGETINGKINRELNLTPQETGFEPKQLGTLRNVIYMRVCRLSGRLFHCRVEKKVCDHPLCFTAVPAVTTGGQSVWYWLFIYRIFCMYYTVCSCVMCLPLSVFQSVEQTKLHRLKAPFCGK